MMLVGFYSLPAWADPLDRGEAYTERGTPPEWMDGTDFFLLLVDYGGFALTIVLFGWLWSRHQTVVDRVVLMIQRPFSAPFHAADQCSLIPSLLLQGVGVLLAVFALATWVFVCQWLKHQGLGMISMMGLALVALLILRMLKDSPNAKLSSNNAKE